MVAKHSSFSFFSAVRGWWQTLGWVGVSVGIVYLVTHLYHLTALPVFADEAIYIRWAQLIIDDWKQYLFFPLNDGKTPLQMWLMVPWQFVFSDQLWAARWLSVLVGLFQLGSIAAIIKALGGRPKTQLVGMALTTILPFWYFHHRMALTDALLTLCISWAVWGAIRLTQVAATEKPVITKRQSLWLMVTGISFGLALLSKIPAILVAPSLLTWCLYPQNISWTKRGHLFIKLSVATGIGIMLFATLKLHPAFGQLFGRGSDFLYPWRDVLLEGKWQETLRNIPTYFTYVMAYLSLPVLLLTVASVFSKSRQRAHGLLLLSVILFAGPIALLGKVVYPRYFLPIAVWMTVSAALFLEELIVRYVYQSSSLIKKVLAAVVLTLVVVNIIGLSTRFILFSLFKSNDTPFVAADQVQYLHEWSSGHGITETVELITTTAQTQTVAVATEGSFGTLPDGLLLYFHRRPVDNIYVEGIGYPVKGIPEFFKTRARDFDTSWLVVNSHRMELNLPSAKLVTEYCRPHQAPCLQVWDITDLVKTSTTTESAVVSQ